MRRAQEVLGAGAQGPQGPEALTSAGSVLYWKERTQFGASVSEGNLRTLFKESLKEGRRIRRRAYGAASRSER